MSDRYGRAAEERESALRRLLVSTAGFEDVFGEQLALVPGADPDVLIECARERWQPVKTFCMFSGGGDSLVLGHRCVEHYDELFYIRTGTEVDERPEGPAVIEHVERCAGELGKPLMVVDAAEAFEVMVLGDGLWWERYRNTGHGRSIEQFIEDDDARYGQAGGFVRETGEQLGQPPHGFPSPGAHGRAYTRLKERQIEECLRIVKADHPRTASVMFLSGVRKDESQRRKGRPALTERGGSKFVNPLTDWKNAEMARYRAEHGLLRSDISLLLGRSGECNCGAFAKATHERAILMRLFPRTWDRIQALEEEAQRRGLRWCRWGGYDLGGILAKEASKEEVGMLCENCERLALDFNV